LVLAFPSQPIALWTELLRQNVLSHRESKILSFCVLQANFWLDESTDFGPFDSVDPAQHAHIRKVKDFGQVNARSQSKWV
jgi:hypothetical protein